MAQPQKARVFMSGRSQAVRIPAEYRFKTDEVFIRRDPQTGISFFLKNLVVGRNCLPRWMRPEFQMILWKIETKERCRFEKNCEPALYA